MEFLYNITDTYSVDSKALINYCASFHVNIVLCFMIKNYRTAINCTIWYKLTWLIYW